jgi:hypothetical protein
MTKMVVNIGVGGEAVTPVAADRPHVRRNQERATAIQGLHSGADDQSGKFAREIWLSRTSSKNFV